MSPGFVGAGEGSGERVLTGASSWVEGESVMVISGAIVAVASCEGEVGNVLSLMCAYVCYCVVVGWSIQRRWIVDLVTLSTAGFSSVSTVYCRKRCSIVCIACTPRKECRRLVLLI